MSINQLSSIYKQEPKFYLTNPNLEIIHAFTDVYNHKLITQYDNLHELSLSIPYKVDINHQLVDNPAITLVRERLIIKLVLGQLEEYFLINKLTKSDNVTTSEVMDLTIHCFHLPYELHYKKYKNYSATSYNCLQVTNDCLDGTPWKIGYIDPIFNTKFRQFDLSGGNRLDFLNQISSSFTAIKTYDTKNRLVNFYQENDVSIFKGWNIKPGQYLDGISDEIDLDQMCVRLYCEGNNGLTFNDVSPNGQSYIEDFSHFLYPFEMDSDGNVIQHSDYAMSDALCKAILDHGKLLVQNQGVLSNYLNQISVLQQDITDINNKINEDKNNLDIVNYDIQITNTNGQDTTALNQQKIDLTNDLALQNSLLTDKNSQIDSIKTTINDLKNVLILENYLKNNNLSYLLDELKQYTIFEDDFTDDNIIDATDLYNEGLTELAKRNSPPVNISISLIDFLACVEESYNWNRLSIGDLVNIIHPTLGIKVQARITKIEKDFESESIQIEISNATRILSDEQKVINKLYSTNRAASDYTNRKTDILKTSYNFNSRNDRISETPVDPTFNNDATDITHVKNDDGSVTLTVNWKYPNDMTVNENNIDGFKVYMYASKDIENITVDSLKVYDAIGNPSADIRTFTIPSVPANLYYYIGVQAYRDVDNDIDSSGIILSKITKSSYIDNYPYRPETTVDVKGKLNGIIFVASDTEPLNPQINTEWTDTSTNTKKIYTSDGWKELSSGASSLNGFEASATITPSTIPIRDNSGNIPGDITGSSQYLNGKSDTDFAQLDSTGKVSTTVLPTTFYFSSYTGDGTGYRTISLPFTPKFVRVYTTNTSDISLFITSVNGGYKLNTSTSSVVLVGMSDGTPYAQFGKIGNKSFAVGQDINLYGNKNGILYYYEAFL